MYSHDDINGDVIGGYRDSATYPALVAIEFVILTVYWIDFSLDTYNRGSGVLTAGKWQVNFTVTLLLFIDLIIEAAMHVMTLTTTYTRHTYDVV